MFRRNAIRLFTLGALLITTGSAVADDIEDNNPSEYEYEEDEGEWDDGWFSKSRKKGDFSGTVCVPVNGADGKPATASCGQSVTFTAGTSSTGSVSLKYDGMSVGFSETNDFSVSITITSELCEECAAYVCYEGTEVEVREHVNKITGRTSISGRTKSITSKEITKRCWERNDCDPSCVDGCGCGDDTCDCSAWECCDEAVAFGCEVLIMDLTECVDPRTGASIDWLCDLPYAERQGIAEYIDSPYGDSGLDLCTMIFIDAGGYTHVIDLTATSDPLRAKCEWDVTQDGAVDALDVADLIGRLGEDGCWDDFDGDGVITEADVAILTSHLGGCAVQHEEVEFESRGF